MLYFPWKPRICTTPNFPTGLKHFGIPEGEQAYTCLCSCPIWHSLAGCWLMGAGCACSLQTAIRAFSRWKGIWIQQGFGCNQAILHQPLPPADGQKTPVLAVWARNTHHQSTLRLETLPSYWQCAYQKTADPCGAKEIVWAGTQSLVGRRRVIPVTRDMALRNSWH